MRIFRGFQKGFTALELISTLGVISLLAVSAAIGANAMRIQGLSKDLADADFQIVRAARANYVNASSFNGLDTEEAITQGIIPEQYITGADSASNAFGGDLAVTVATITNTDDGFDVANAGLVSDACINAVNSAFRSAVTIEVGGTEVKAAGETTLDVADTSAACDNAANIVTATYSKNG